MTDINLDLSRHCEVVCLLGKWKPDTTVKLSEDMNDYYRIINGKDEELWFRYSDSFMLIIYLILEEN